MQRGTAFADGEPGLGGLCAKFFVAEYKSL